MKPLDKCKIAFKPRYLMRICVFIYLKSLDFFCDFFNKRKSLQINKEPQKILLTNLAHLGDVINATCVLTVLKKAFPKVKIGFVVGRHALEVVKDHPLIDKIYVVDHWLLNRSKSSLFNQLLCYFSTYRKALKEIRSDEYDLSIDLYIYIGKVSSLPYRAYIPNRIGYNMRIGRNKSCGGNLLTHCLKFVDKKQHITDYYKDLLKLLSIDDHLIKDSKPYLKSFSDSIFEELSKRFSLSSFGYIVLHPGTGASQKKWPLNYWKGLVFLLLQYNYKIIITGKGLEDKFIADRISKLDSSIVNLVDKLDFVQLRSIIKNAQLLVGVDSLAGHLAAELATASVLIFSGITHLGEWTPKSNKASLIQAKVPCSPCYIGSGCQTMECIRKITPETVFKKIQQVLL